MGAECGDGGVGDDGESGGVRLGPGARRFFQQSRISAHLHLAWILNSFVSVQALTRLSQYKEKAKSIGLQHGTPSGLLIYPVLQAADILLYKATHVPVGDDQTQHFQVLHTIVQHANAALRPQAPPLFTLPQMLTARVPRLKSLRSATAKMSKSDPSSCLLVTDEPGVVRAKVKKALTDCIGRVEYDPEQRPAVANLVFLHSIVSGKSTSQIVEEARGMQTAEYKFVLADAVSERFVDIRARYEDLIRQPHYLRCILDDGTEKARLVAQATLAEVQAALDH